MELSQLQSTTAICPSLFNATSAQDGILSRIRIPAGMITASQIGSIANLANQFGDGTIQITNRANLQIRTSQALTLEVLQDLQDYGLASSTESIDGLRNIMASPTAGIDVQAKINTVPLVKQWNLYLSQHPELAILSNKFSVCFDGGETINVGDRPNDICFVAVEVNGEIYFDLHLGLELDLGVLIPSKQVIKVLAALTEVYRDYTQQKLDQNYSRSRPPRLRELLHDWGVERYLQLVQQKLRSPLRLLENGAFDNLNHKSKVPLFKGDAEGRGINHLGIHAQKQAGLFYIGVVIPLGRLTSLQLQGLGNLAKQYGGGALRLTPWQNVLISDIAESLIEQVTRAIAELGLPISANHPYAAIAACSGIKGCKAALTDTQSDAKAIATHLENSIKLDHPINIHFSGCDKSCAQHHPSDIALVGIQSDPETYKVFIGEGDISFGRELYANYFAKDLPNLMERLLKIYQNQHQNFEQNSGQNPEQSFREFVNKCNLRQLKQLLDHA